MECLREVFQDRCIPAFFDRLQPLLLGQTIEERIGELCNSEGISVDTMLQEVGLNETVIDDIRKGSVLSVDKINAIAEYFNTTLSYLLGRVDHPFLVKPNKILLEFWSEMPDNERVCFQNRHRRRSVDFQREINRMAGLSYEELLDYLALLEKWKERHIRKE